MAILYFPLLALLCVAAVPFRGRPGVARVLYGAALLLSVLPYLLHVRYTWGFVSGWGDPMPRAGVYPGLRAYAAVAVGIAALLVALAAWLLRRAPLATALVPALLWLGYWFACLPLLGWRAPDEVPLDNVPLVWLFASSAFATPLLAGCAWLALRPGRAGVDGGRSNPIAPPASGGPDSPASRALPP